MKRIFIILLSIVILVNLFMACNITGRKVAPNKLNVVVSFNPIREFVGAIGKDRVDIYTVVPDGTEPHDFEPKAKDIMNIDDSKVFIYNGLGIETWVKEVSAAISSKKFVKVEASKNCDLILNLEASGVDRQYDPHIWLSLKEAKIECNNIRLALIKADSKNRVYYNKNYEEFASKLNDLYKEYNLKFSKLKNKNLVTGHAAFGYLCRDFGLKQNSVEDVFADGEPSATQLKNLVDYCKARNIKTVFTESMVSLRISQTLADEVGAKVKKIYTLESREDNKDYLTCMKYNLEEIYTSLAGKN